MKFKIGDLVKYDGDLNLKNRGIGIVIDVKKSPEGAKVYWSKWQVKEPWIYFNWLEKIK